MDHAFSLERHLDERAPGAAVIIGAGYIGCEMADALTRRGLDVTVVEQAASPLPTFDPSLGRLVARELTRHGVSMRSEVTILELAENGRQVRVTGTDGFAAGADLVLLVAGVRPDAALAVAAGAEAGIREALRGDHPPERVGRRPSVERSRARRPCP